MSNDYAFCRNTTLNYKNTDSVRQKYKISHKYLTSLNKDSKKQTETENNVANKRSLYIIRSAIIINMH